MVKTRAASIAALTCPAANGAIVSGTIATDNNRSNVQWYEPCVGEGFGTGAGSLIPPWITWGPGGMICACAVDEKGAILDVKDDGLRRAAVVGRMNEDARRAVVLVEMERRDSRVACRSIDVLASDAMLTV